MEKEWREGIEKRQRKTIQSRDMVEARNSSKDGQGQKKKPYA